MVYWKNRCLSYLFALGSESAQMNRDRLTNHRIKSICKHPLNIVRALLNLGVGLLNLDIRTLHCKLCSLGEHGQLNTSRIQIKQHFMFWFHYLLLCSHSDFIPYWTNLWYSNECVLQLNDLNSLISSSLILQKDI